MFFQLFLKSIQMLRCSNVEIVAGNCRSCQNFTFKFGFRNYRWSFTGFNYFHCTAM